ncbi:efflux RND transporter permease subunit [Thalassotalea mangrovi]|uniref:Efflux RND transporter permease subunit n=1 Tax=Thalassotalea mangrovi TaxID=2572245 RepID=A0A4U1B3U0_9GAMM|nr:efflux RND transporter permease subunit [Thalassotalea mangrovi]TKB44557.1 efflux RND transporter permease subunit [Thalassotalea mangrovi]
MIEIFVRNGRLMALLIILLVVAGLASLSALPRSEDPTMENRFGLVITQYPGASAERVEALVTEKIEQKLQTLSEIEYLASTSRPGISVIQVKLEGHITDSKPVFSRIRDLLADVSPQLPAESSPPRFDEERSFAYTRLIALNWQDDNRDAQPDLLIMGRYAKELQSQLRLVAGTDIVDIHGINDEEIVVELDQQKAALANISAQQVAQAVLAADVKVPAGKLFNANNQLQIEVVGALDSLQRIRNIPLRSDDNQILRIADVANVTRQLQQPLSEIAIINGKPALVVATRMVRGIRIDQWSQRVDAKTEELAKLLPSSMSLQVLFDQNTYTDARLSDLVDNILLGFLIIALVLFITLGWRAAIIVVVSLPLTVLFTLSVMNFTGLPIHQMSVTGLVVALGIMVDNAIVMTDSIQQRKQRGINGLQAVLQSVRHLWLPLLGSTLTTILAFMPIVLMPGDAGEFIGGIALSVIFSLIGSYLISHTIVSGLSGRFVKRDQAPHWYNQGLRINALEQHFRNSLTWSLRFPKTIIALVFSLPIAGFIAAGSLSEQFFPPSDRDMFHIEVFLPPQNSINATKALTDEISTALYQHQGIEDVRWFIGKSAPAFYYNLIAAKDGMQNYAQAMITTTDFKEANRLIPKLQRQLDDQFPQAQVLVRKLEQGPPFNAPIEIRIYGPNLDTLQEIGARLRRIFSETKDVVHTRATLLAGTPKAWVKADEDAISTLQLSLGALAGQLEGSLQGRPQGSVIEATESINVRVRASDEHRQGISDLTNFPIINAATGEFIPLSAVSEVNIEPSRGAIPHRDGKRVNVIEGYLRAGVLPSVVLDKIKAQIDNGALDVPYGYSLEIGGESDARNKAVGKLLGSVGIILTLLITVVVLSFNSFRVSAVIFIAAFMSMGLGLLSVFVFNYPFGFTVIVGLLGLMGLAINSAIVILAELKADEAAIHGNKEAIIHGVLSCTRHISSTTITTVGGFLPLILAGGGFWPPFAIAIAGGTVLTTLLSFYFVPATFYLMSRKRSFDLTASFAS